MNTTMTMTMTITMTSTISVCILPWTLCILSWHLHFSRRRAKVWQTLMRYWLRGLMCWCWSCVVLCCCLHRWCCLTQIINLSVSALIMIILHIKCLHIYSWKTWNRKHNNQQYGFRGAALEDWDQIYIWNIWYEYG